jgi:cell division protein FtsB
MMRYWVVAALCLLIGGGVLVHTFMFSDGWSSREHARNDLEKMMEENEAAEVKTQNMRRRINAIRERLDVQERAVRQEIGYVRPGEIVVDLSPPDQESK